MLTKTLKIGNFGLYEKGFVAEVCVLQVTVFLFGSVIVALVDF